MLRSEQNSTPCLPDVGTWAFCSDSCRFGIGFMLFRSTTWHENVETLLSALFFVHAFAIFMAGVHMA
jgi:hypothetical protein